MGTRYTQLTKALGYHLRNPRNPRNAEARKEFESLSKQLIELNSAARFQAFFDPENQYDQTLRNIRAVHEKLCLICDRWPELH